MLLERGIALAGAWLVDCRACHTAPLAVGVLVSLPFFVAGWLALVASKPDHWHAGWFAPLLVAILVQVLWALPLTYATTLRGQCPCAGFIFNTSETTLSAIGIDHWVGPILLVEAVVTLWLAWTAFKAQPNPRAG